MTKWYLQLEEEIKLDEGGDFEDEELVMQSLNNPRLFELFVEKYQEVFLRTAKRVLKNNEESEDVVQDAFVKIYFNAKKFQKRPGIKFKSWAFKILMNCVFTRYQKQKRRMNDVEYMDQVLYMRDRSADLDFKKSEMRDEIESILNEMPDDLSDLMKEHYLEDKPYAEIADSKGMSIAALKMKLFRARNKFKEVSEEI